MKYRFEWTKLCNGFTASLSVTEETVVKAQRKLAAVFGLTLPVMRQRLSIEGYQLSVIESEKEKTK